MALDQQTLLDRYQRGVSNGATNYRQGVTGSGSKWKTNASSDVAEQSYAAGVQRAAQNRTRQRRLANVTATDWETAAQNIGATNYAASAAKAATNYGRVVANVIGAANAASNAANALPGGTIADNLNRAREAQIAAHRYWAQVNGETPQI